MKVIDPPASASEDYEVWDENWDIVMMFLRLQTQWNTTMAGFMGIKYEVLQWLCGLYSVEDPRAMFEGIRIMEASALQVLNNRD